MLLVKNSMTREVVTLSPQTTGWRGARPVQESRIRHLPVLEGGRLVGIVSDRDLRSATPALGDPARAEALGRSCPRGRRGGDDRAARRSHRRGGERDAGEEDRLPARRRGRGASMGSSPPRT